MHLLSCEHPIRVFNKYIGQYVWTSCGKCNSCRNAKAFRWTEALERERLLHRYCMFVTLTYDDVNLPRLELGFFHGVSGDDLENQFDLQDPLLVSSVQKDNICIPYSRLIHKNDVYYEDTIAEEKALFFGIYRQFNGIPYASYTDLQLFHKILNKYFHDHVSNQFKNFRYFCVSEFGSTTLRPHFHGIYFVDRKDVAELFAQAVRLCWRKGISDTQFVEKSACGYVAQYINKSADLPFFYKTRELMSKYWFSKRPIIGCQDFTNSQSVMLDDSQDLRKIFDSGSVETCCRRNAHSTNFVLRPLHKSVESRLYPKCPSFKSVSHSCRAQLYYISSRFGVENFERPFEVFRRNVTAFLDNIYSKYLRFDYYQPTEFSDFLYEMFYRPWIEGDEDESERAYGWLRRLYYMSRKVVQNACHFGVSLFTYVNKIVDYWDKKELYVLSKFYNFQSSYVGISDDLSLMYPEYLHDCDMTIGEFFENVNLPKDVLIQRCDGAAFALSNKKTHFKNAYLDSLKFKESYTSLFYSLKNYYYAKKCYETLETVAA